jgi:transmembrane sensor
MGSPSDAVLARYVAGECSSAEAREIERWAAEDPANSVRLAELRALWQAAAPPPPWDIEGMWAGVRRTMRADRGRSVRIGRAFPSRRWWGSPLVAAALVGVTAGASLLVLRVSADRPTAQASLPMREYVTPRGQRATFQLPDGTRLVLAPASRLRVPADYRRGVREVYLEGEALFDVVHDSTQPFRVHARDAVAEDLGTRFDVRAYPEDAAVAVAVAEGAVALGRAAPRGTASAGDAPQGVVLREGELGTLDAAGRVTTARGAALAAYLSWADGRLHFVNTPLPQVAHEVGRWFDLDVRLEGAALADRTVTADFEAQSADELLRALALAVDAQVARSGSTVTLQSGSHPPTQVAP